MQSTAWRSTLYPDAWTPPVSASFATDKMIQDFSYAGYRRGEHPVPAVAGPVFDVTNYGADPTGVNDSTAAIQAAINAAANAGGGVARLPAGTFRVSLPAGANEVLRIRNPNVVLRGAGSGQTFLLNTTHVMRNKAIIRISPNSVSAGTTTAFTADLHTPTRRIPVANPSAFAVGDIVRMLWDFTDGWIADHQQQTWWKGTNRPAAANYRREITAVNAAGGWIEVDVPTRYSMLMRDNARIGKLTGMITGAAIEGISIGNVQHPGTTWGESDYGIAGTPGYDVHASWVVAVQNARDCWVSDIHSFQPAGNISTCHILSNGISLVDSFRVTVRNCAMRRAQYGGGGGNGYMYRLQNANDCLVAGSIADFSRHGFVVSHAGTTGNVFHRCEDRETARATGSTGSMSTSGVSSDNHMHFSHSNLWDQCHAFNSTFEAKHRHGMGTIPHGLTSAHGVYWNTRGSGTRFNTIVTSEQGRYGYVIGISGTNKGASVVNPANYNTAPLDHLEGNGQGATLEPQSLFLDQQERRLALPSVTILPLTPIRLPDNVFSLEAVFTDEGVTITGIDSVTWTVIATPAGALVTPDGTATLNPSFQVDKAGTYTINVFVEHEGKSASAATRVEVLPEYEPTLQISLTNPIRMPDNVFTLAAGISLGGQPVSDFDSVTWSVTSAPSEAVFSITNGTTLTPSITVDREGTYVVSATLQRDGKTTSSQISVDVLPEYQPELVLSVTDAARLPDNEFSLAAAILYAGEPVEDFDSISWSVVSVPDGAGVTITGGTTLTPTFTVTDAGTYIVQADLLRDGKSATRQISVVVVPEGGLDHVFANMLNLNFTVPNGDNLIVGSGSSNSMRISFGDSNTVARTVDASSAASVTINVGDLRIGMRSDPTSTGKRDSADYMDGRLHLGAFNTITATTHVEVGSNGHINTGILTTASNSATAINTPVMSIGASMRTGSAPAPAPPVPAPNLTIGAGSSLALQGISGGRAALIVGEERNASSTINWSSSGTMNLSGGQASLKLGSLIVGRSLFAASETGTATGTFTMSNNTANQLDISGTGSVVQVGVSSGNQTTGTMTIGNLGSNSTITSTNNGTAILIGNRTTSTGDVVTGTLNLNGGTLTITTSGAAIAGGGNATSNLNLGGGVTLRAGASSTNWIHNFDTATIDSGGAIIDTNGFNLSIPQAFTGTGGLTKAGAGTLVLSTAQGYTGPTLVAGGTLVLDAANTATTGGLTITGNGRLGGNGATPAAVLIQNGGMLLTEITDWTGTPGSGFTDLHVGPLAIQDNWVVDVTSPNAYMNFSDAGRSFPILTATGGITGFSPGKASVQVHGDFFGSGTWSVEQSGNTLLLVYSMVTPPVDDYAAWQDEYPDTDLEDPDADLDGDGLSNFHEYAFGLDPTDGASANPVSGFANLKSHGTFYYTRRSGSGLDYTVWKSTDLRDWHPATVAQHAGDLDGNGVQTVAVEILEPMPDGGFFLCVRAQRPES
jgi:autotransporter-associated beta strand protein